PRINWTAGEVAGEYRIRGINEALASKSPALQIDRRNFVYEQKRGAMRNQPLDIITLDKHVACGSGRRPEGSTCSGASDRIQRLRLHFEPPEASESRPEALASLIQDHRCGSSPDVCIRGGPYCREHISVQ